MFARKISMNPTKLEVNVKITTYIDDDERRVIVDMLGTKVAYGFDELLKEAPDAFETCASLRAYAHSKFLLAIAEKVGEL